MRCFLAIELPEGLRESLRNQAEALRLIGADFRVPAAEAIHLTVRFFGDISGEQVDTIARGLDESLAGTGSFETTLSGLGVFPSVTAARVLWTGATDGGSGGLLRCREMADFSAAAAGVRPDPQPYRPHVTIGRFREGARREEVRALLDATAALAPCAFPVSAVSLWSSELGPSGPRHTKLEDVIL